MFVYTEPRSADQNSRRPAPSLPLSYLSPCWVASLPLYLAFPSSRDEKLVTAAPLDSALTNRDICKSFRIRSYENCRVVPTARSLICSVTHLKSTLVSCPLTVDSKGLTELLTPLDATLIKTRGRVACFSLGPATRHSPLATGFRRERCRASRQERSGPHKPGESPALQVADGHDMSCPYTEESGVELRRWSIPLRCATKFSTTRTALAAKAAASRRTPNEGASAEQV